MTTYDIYKFYNEVPAPEIETAGIADLMRIPADGVNRNSHINWNGARFAVKATFIDKQPNHQVIVDYPSERSETGRYTQGMAIDMAFDLAGNSTPEAVATTSGGHAEGMGRLSYEQRQVVGQLIQRSIDAGSEKSSSNSVF